MADIVIYFRETEAYAKQIQYYNCSYFIETLEAKLFNEVTSELLDYSGGGKPVKQVTQLRHSAVVSILGEGGNNQTMPNSESPYR